MVLGLQGGGLAGLGLKPRRSSGRRSRGSGSPGHRSHGPEPKEGPLWLKTARRPSQANTGIFQTNTRIAYIERGPFKTDKGPVQAEKVPRSIKRLPACQVNITPSQSNMWPLYPATGNGVKNYAPGKRSSRICPPPPPTANSAPMSARITNFLGDGLIEDLYL